jgi:hypothetical protein
MAQSKILNILWKLNSPYGTYTANEYVDVYWDDVTLALVVHENGIVITSGADIPARFTYGGLTDFFYKTEKFYQVSICNGTSLLLFERIPAFPYIYIVETQNHPTCSLSGEVCDLNFDSLPVITGVSTATSLDGQMVVSASGSNGSVKYRLNSDFEYNDGFGQVSGTFTGLGKGNYLVYARDEKNCLSVISVTIPIAHTYGVKYRLEFYDIRLNYHNKTEILEKDYSGSVTEVLGGNADPTVYSLRGEGEMDKFIPRITGEISFSILSQAEGQFHDLATNDPEKFRIRHSIDDGGGYDIMFVGKMLPNQYEEAYVSAPYPVNVIATDGTAILADIPFLDDGGNRLTGSYKQIILIAWILKKIGLDLNIRSGCNIYALTMDATASDDPLDQAYVDVLRYYLIKETPSCLEVLEWILEPYGAQLIQYYNVWNIIRVEERVNSFDYREFDDEGVYVSNSSYNPVKNIVRQSSTGLWWVDQSQSLRINPGYGELRLMYNMGRKANIYENGDFRVRNYSVYQASVIIPGTTIATEQGPISGTIPDLTGFQIVNNGVNVTKSIEPIEKGNVALVIRSGGVGAYLLSDTITLKMGNSEEIKLTCRFKIRATYNTNAHYVKVKVQVGYGDYYLQDSGQWTDTETNIVFYVEYEQLNKYQTLEVIAASPDPLYYTGESFSIKFFAAHEADYAFPTKVLLEAFPTVGKPEGTKTELLDDDTYVGLDVINYYELRNETHAADFPSIIKPDDYHADTNPYKWILVATNTIVADIVYETSLDKIQLEILSNGNELPESMTSITKMENENTLKLDKIIYHGSLTTNGGFSFNYGFSVVPTQEEYFWGSPFSLNIFYGDTFEGSIQFVAESADVYYCGYLRDSAGEGYTTWSRSSRVEALTLQDINTNMYSAQYSQPWRSLTGPFTGNVLFSPIDVIKETMDNNRKYFPPYLTINYKTNSYHAQFSELISTDDADIDLDDPSTDGAGFSTGFSLGFNA